MADIEELIKRKVSELVSRHIDNFELKGPDQQQAHMLSKIENTQLQADVIYNPNTKQVLAFRLVPDWESAAEREDRLRELQEEADRAQGKLPPKEPHGL